MTETRPACYFGLDPANQANIMRERIGAASATTEGMLGVQLCDRDQCTLSVAGIIRAGFTPQVAPQLMETRDADLALELAPDCVRFNSEEL